MKKLFLSLMMALCAVCVWGQSMTAEEIIAKMDEKMEGRDSENVHMIMEMKMPIIGTMKMEMWNVGDKSRTEGSMMGHQLVIFEDKTTEWEYDSNENTVTIKPAKEGGSSDSDNAEMLSGITDGYTVKIKKETATEWIIACKKSKDNKEKDDPNNMELTVSKADYMPIKLTTSMKGVKLTMRDFSFGTVSEKFVTYDDSLFPGAKIVDKR